MTFSITRFARHGLATITICLAAGTAQADMPTGERGYPDSFGNLVVISPGGAKRIVVGRGDLAPRRARHEGGSVRGSETATARRSGDPCRFTGPRLQGRSHLYGLPSDVVPIIRSCG